MPFYFNLKLCQILIIENMKKDLIFYIEHMHFIRLEESLLSFLLQFI